MTDFSSCVRLRCFQLEKQGKTHRSSRLVAPRATFVLAISLRLYIYLKKKKARKKKRTNDRTRTKIAHLHKILDVRIVLPNGKLKIADRSCEKIYLPLDLDLRLRFHRGLEDAG